MTARRIHRWLGSSSRPPVLHVPGRFRPGTDADETVRATVGQAGKDVVWVPTPQVLVDKMLDMAKLTPQDIHFDLGSGDGRTVITAAKRGATSTGIEDNPDMVELSQRNAKAAEIRPIKPRS